MEEDKEYKQVQGCDVKYPIPTFLNPGMEPESPELQADSLPTEPPTRE